MLLASHLSDFWVWSAQDLQNSGLSCLPHSILVRLWLPYADDPVFISQPLPSFLPPIPIYNGLLNIFTQISNSHLKFSKIKPELWFSITSSPNGSGQKPWSHLYPSLSFTPHSCFISNCQLCPRSTQTLTLLTATFKAPIIPTWFIQAHSNGLPTFILAPVQYIPGWEAEWAF